MDRAMILDHFHQAAKHVRRGIVHVENQRSLIADLEAHGHDSEEAISLLRRFEEMLELHQADMNRLWTALGKPGLAEI
jgi:hypothetical protein